MDQLPRLGKRGLICLQLFTCNYVVSVWGGFLFLWVLGMGYVILLWHSLSLPYNYFRDIVQMMQESGYSGSFCVAFKLGLNVGMFNTVIYMYGKIVWCPFNLLSSAYLVHI